MRMQSSIVPIGKVRQRRLGPAILYVILGAILLLLPPFMPLYLQSLLTKVLIFGIFALGLNILYGYTGLYSLGHAAYFGAAGYATGILIVKYGVESFWIAAPAGLLVTVLIALVFAAVTLRVRSISHYVMITLALGQLVYSVAWKWTTLTGGSGGLAGIEPPDLGFPLTWNAITFYYFVFLAFAICFFLLYRFVNSPLGLVLQGIRESETRMRSLGYNTWLYKYIASVVGALFAGVAGILFAYFSKVMLPSQAGVTYSAIVMLMVAIGSDRLFFGPVIGAALFEFSEFYAGVYLPQHWPLILGAIFVISGVLLHGGISIHMTGLMKKVRYQDANIKG